MPHRTDPDPAGGQLAIAIPALEVPSRHGIAVSLVWIAILLLKMTSIALLLSPLVAGAALLAGLL